MLLQVENLKTHFITREGTIRAVDGVSLEISRGKTVALVGESGCGKTVAALSILRLVPQPGRIAADRILLEGRDLLALSDRQMRAVRGNRIAMIFQEPMSSLNPVLTVGGQIVEALRLHRRLSGRAARRRAIELLKRVGIPAAAQRVREYPHQMSGGMRQRVMLAMALACEPNLLIADEPTTALDVTVQAQILELLRDLQQRSGLAILLITHDLGVVAEFADEVCVMYAGRIVERAPVELLFGDPRHPYTQGLLRSTPRLSADADSHARTARLEVIAGEVPNPLRLPAGCAFHPRCERGRGDPTCRTEDPPLVEVTPQQRCACWKGTGYPARALAAHG
jgi:peptide/nickel transport system ATP-binding protein